MSLTGADSAGPGFTAPTLVPGADAAMLVFSLVVNDGIVDSVADTVTITVEAPANVAPTADAGGDTTVASGDTVTLDGSGSSANNVGQTLTYAWTQTGGTDVSLTGADSAGPGFTAPTLVPGADAAMLVFSLVVNDGIVDSVADTVTITVNAPANVAPTADAGGDTTVASGARVTLDGSGSSANNVGQTLTYAWTQTGGTDVSLTGADSAGPGFTAPTLVPGADAAMLVFSLVVNDGIVDSVADTVTITVNAPANVAPTADAGGDTTVASGDTVSLDGSGSSANNVGQTLTYAWTQTGGTDVSLTGADSAGPGFTAPTLVPGADAAMLVFSLVVNDGIVDSVADTVTITVNAPANVAPTADAGGDTTVASGARVTLDGSASSDSDGTIATYAWTASDGVTLTGANTASPGFTAPTLVAGAVDVTRTFTLTVTDNDGATATDTVIITVEAPDGSPNAGPTADAGDDRTVASGAEVMLDGAASSANNAGQTLTYAWTQASGPDVELTGDTTARPGFTAPALPFNAADALLTFSLIVNDGFVDSAADTVVITVRAQVDVTSPTVTLTGPPENYTPGTPFGVIITFSEPVTGFVADDITVANGTVTGLTGAGAIYTARISPSASAQINISVPAGVAMDVAGNPNQASAVITVAPNTAEIAEEAIVDALTARGQALIAAQPNLHGCLGGPGLSGLSANVTGERGRFRFGLDCDRRVWLLAQGQWSDSDTTELDYFNLTFGSHLYRSDNVNIGAMLQLDSAEATLAAGTFEGQGWLIGPYVVARLPDQPLSFSASLLHGRTDNTLTLTGQAPDEFSSNRTLFTAGVEGRYSFPNELTLIPSLDLAHVSDRQEAYVDSLANPVPEQTIRLTEASFGLGFERPFQLENGDLLLTGGISGIYSDLDAPGRSESSTRARIDLGARINIGPWTTLSLGAHYDGIGDDDYEAYGAALVFEMKF